MAAVTTVAGLAAAAAGAMAVSEVPIPCELACAYPDQKNSNSATFYHLQCFGQEIHVCACIVCCVNQKMNESYHAKRSRSA
jgi:hypothetical protein